MEDEEDRLLHKDADFDNYAVKDRDVGSQRPRLTNVRLILYIEIIHFILFLVAISVWYIINNPIQSAQPISITSYAHLSQQKSIVSFSEDEDSVLNATLPTPDGDSLWYNLTFGNNNGLVSLPTSFVNNYNLPETHLPTNPDEHVYHLNAFHQLHCLSKIRSYIIAPLRNSTSNDTSPQPEVPFYHTLHCIDFLRRVLMCHADLTLFDSSIDPGFTGYGSRQCMDWEAVTKWVSDNAWEKQRFIHDDGI